MWGWAHLQAGAEVEAGSSAPPGLLFKHKGHSGKVVDFQWSTAEPWMILSIDDGEGSGGASVQVRE